MYGDGGGRDWGRGGGGRKRRIDDWGRDGGGRWVGDSEVERMEEKGEIKRGVLGGWLKGMDRGEVGVGK